MPEITIVACTADPVKEQAPSSRRSSSASLVKGFHLIVVILSNFQCSKFQK